MKSYLDFSGKVVLVTGSTRGIGYIIARMFAEYGASVVINGRTAASLNRAVEALKTKEDDRVLGVPADVGSWEDVSSLFNVIEENYGSPDVVIHNAAVRPYAAIEDIDETVWNETVRTNLNGGFFVSKAAIPSMKKKRAGSIIYISSIAPLSVPDYYVGAHYIASKGGLLSMAKGLAKELGNCNIRVNAIAPGVIDTGETKPQEVSMHAQKTPFLKRQGRPEEVASACLFLASDMASYVTGEVISLGGY